MGEGALASETMLFASRVLRITCYVRRRLKPTSCHASIKCWAPMLSNLHRATGRTEVPLFL